MCTVTKIKECQHCQEGFEAKRKNHRYCSASCRVMACYKRKGYTYISGHYAKLQPAMVGTVPAVAAAVAITDPLTPLMPLTTISQNTSPPIGMQPVPARKSNEVSMAGIAENLIGASAVELAKYLLHDQQLMAHVKEILKRVIAIDQKLQPQKQQLQGQVVQAVKYPQQFQQPIQSPLTPKAGMQPIIKKAPPATPLNPFEQIRQRMGLESKQPPGSGNDISWM